MASTATPTNAEVLSQLQDIRKFLEKAGGPKSNGSTDPGKMFAGWQPKEKAHEWPDQRSIDAISKNYNSEEALMWLVRNGRAKASGMGPALVNIHAMKYPGHAGMTVKDGYNDDRLEEEYGFTSVAKAASRGRKGLNGQVEKTVNNESSGIAGGYIVPPQFQNQLLTIAAEESFIEPRCTILPMTTATAQWPLLDITTNYGTGVTPYYGGVIATWQPESQTIDQTNPQFKMDTWTAWNLQLLTIATNQLLADNGIGLDALLTQLFGGALSWYRDYAFLQGLGAGSSMPLGVLNSPCLYQQSRTAPNSFKLADAATMMSRLQIRSWKDACWVMHQSVLPQLIQMNAGGTNGFLVWLNPLGQGVNGPAANTMPLTFMGLPIFWTEKVPQLGSMGDVGLYDWSRYVVGQRMDMQIDVSREYRFAQNQMTWRIISRLDGKSWLSSTVHDASGWEISPFVALAA